MPLVSIIIPTWNRQEKLKECIESILKQTFLDYEILVCDDGSTDDSCHIIQRFNDPRIKFIAGQHSGKPAVPRNKGIRLAKGKWFAFLDSDDLWLPTKLENQIALLEKKSAKACCTNAYVKKNNVIMDVPLFSLKKNQLIFNDILVTNYIVTSSVIIHRSLIDLCNNFPEDLELKAVEDYALWLRILTYNSFVYISIPLVIYTDDTSNSVRVSSINNQYLQKYFVFRNFNKWLRDKRHIKIIKIKSISMIFITYTWYIIKEYAKKIVK